MTFVNTITSKTDIDLKDLLSTIKRFNDNKGMQFGQEKCAKVTIKKGSLVRSKNIARNINTEIIDLEHDRTSRYLEIDEVNGIDHKKIKGP